ncbi:uncharacterized protein gogo isoform X3 [Tribolium castaneum]|nr:PREDICTED: uncharacterized protein LOC658166 isoform X3 [Tribolium castaneum]|eukprot:XP_015837696.1 PREDICTED: uncharacterized protein LOC658166 isoform X3 [Tribolium castaneum]
MKKIALCRALMNFPLFLLVFCLAKDGDAGGSIPGIELSMPPSHIALSGDLHIQITSSSFPPLMLQLSRLEGNIAQPLTTFPVLPEARALSLNTTIVKIPCGYFSKGGQYYILIKKQPIGGSNSTLVGDDDSVITRSLDVRWPMPQLSVTPEHIQTYPETPVMAILEFPEVVCPPVTDSPISAIPEFWLELHYCGHSLLTCDNDDNRQNNSNVQVLDQVRGFGGRRVFTLRCELFGLAGFYALFLRPTATTQLLPHTAAYVKADWSEQFVFNVHARSILPCDGHSGIKVLFQYPSCILASGDRVRVFARLRANVASLAPPTSLEYVAEKRVIRGQHSLHFDCDLFTERYVEYCFVYVSQAINEAVADVRMDCVPTLPVTENESGGWGPWSPWTPCSSTCIGGTRSRYRFCDSPPPRYGAKFCEGQAVETEKCGKSMGNNWECFYGNVISASDIVAEMPEIQAEVGPYCRCGCVVHLGRAKPKRLLATSSQSCPGRTFWLIQADEEFIIQFKVEQFHLPCGTQWLKVRDGSSLSANLLADLSGAPDTTPSVVNSTGPNLLLEFFSEEIAIGGQICGGGFLAHASQINTRKSNVTGVPIAQSVGVVPAVMLKMTAVHIAAIFFLSGLLIATALLGAQYLFRYRKYHIAQAEDQDSLADPTASCASISLRTRASSSATLLSEVISLTRLRPHTRNKHSRLRESMDCEQEEEVTLAKEESLSMSSTTTLTQQETLTTTLPQTANEMEEVACSLPGSPQSYDQKTLKRSSTLSSEKDKLSEKDDLKSTTSSKISRRLSNGFYSPASSLASTATIKSTNAKETKEKRNREKLLAGPAAGSDFSIGGPENDLEMDYYDYNVVNAGAAPGSYLGMDPAFLVWIPPLDEDGEILPSDEELKPRVYIDPGSNKESPEEEMLLPKSEKRIEITPKDSPILKKSKKVHALIEEEVKEREPLLNKTVVTIQLHELPKNKRSSSTSKLLDEMEKETKVEKSPCLDKDILEEIKYADEDDDEKEPTESQCNIELSYHDSNILSSS